MGQPENEGHDPNPASRRLCWSHPSGHALELDAQPTQEARCNPKCNEQAMVITYSSALAWLTFQNALEQWLHLLFQLEASQMIMPKGSA